MKHKKLSVEIKFNDIGADSCEYVKLNGKDFKTHIQKIEFISDADDGINKLNLMLVPNDIMIVGSIPIIGSIRKMCFVNIEESKYNDKEKKELQNMR